MASFLEQLVDELNDSYKGDLSRLCLVFPTRRAGLFFKKYLSEKINRPHWSPVIYSIQDFIRTFSDHVVPDQLALVFELYEVYKKYFPAESFEKYFPWGEMLLKDFDEADRNLADTKQLFAYIKDINEIDSGFELDDENLGLIRNFWKTFFNKEPGKLKSEFLSNWQHLGNIYYDFRKQLEKRNWAYEGLVCRSVAEEMDQKKVHPEYDKIIFAGFYALTKSEEKIIEHLIKNDNAVIYWDVDSYYYEDVKQEAGTFLRKNRLLKPGFKWKYNDFESGKKDIEVIGVALQVGQAKAVGNILEELTKSNSISPEKTAVVLPDENLLFPVLYSLPESIDTFNVTMGYPLSSTPLFSLFETLILLQKNIRRKKDGTVSFYYRHVTDVLNHSSIQQVESSYIRDWMKAYNKDMRWIQIPVEQLSNEKSPQLFKDIFRSADQPDFLFGYFKKILEHILDSIKEREFKFHEIESEYIYQFYTLLKRLEDTVKEYAHDFSLDVFWNLYRTIIFSTRIPFSGEPLKGLQVMGFLETRLLDFENLFILSVNEDTLPASSSHSSFIPYNIRKAFDLPTYEDQHAVSSYHFYRLLQRAKNIYLLYNTETRSITAGEKSRYLLQIEHELVRKFPGNISIKSRLAVTDFVKQETPSIEIRKTIDVMKSIEKYFLKNGSFNEFTPKLSASALILYITCRLRFYFQYIAKIREQEETEENIEAATFGRILHRSMQLLYGELGNLTESVFDQLKAKVEQAVNRSITEEFRGHDLLEGKNILMRNVIVELVRKIISIDKKDAPVNIHFLEHNVLQPLQVTEDNAVLLYGIIDRVDETKGITRIIDYKTGKVDSSEPENFDEIFSDPKYKEYFQTYFYSYLHWKNTSANSMKAGIIAVKNLSDGIRFINEDAPISSEQFKEFENYLIKLVAEIINPDISFSQTSDEKRCEYCPYKEICHR